MSNQQASQYLISLINRQEKNFISPSGTIYHIPVGTPPGFLPAI
jgi:hypothetical protein